MANVALMARNLFALLAKGSIGDEFPLSALEVLALSMVLVLFFWVTVLINTVGCRLLFDRPAGGARELLTPKGWKHAGLISSALGLTVVTISIASGAWPLAASVLPIFALSASCFWVEKSWYVEIRP